MRPARLSLFAGGALVAIAASAAPARGADPFEIQVYDGTSNAPGVPGLELHLNHVGDGDRAQRGTLLATHHQSHATLEPSLGITRWWELGAYLQTARRGDGTIDWAGAKLRSKFVTPDGWDTRWRLGANFELASIPERYDESGWGAELRPIVAWESSRWLFAVNPIVGVPLGHGASQGPGFEPAAKVMLKLQDQLGVGLEYYADLGPVASPLSFNAQAHYVYEVVDLLALGDVELNAGIGEGLTPASNGVVMKLIVGYSFDAFGADKHPIVHNSIAHNRIGAMPFSR